MDIVAYLIGILPGIISSLLVFYLQRQQKQRDVEDRERAAARKQEALLSLNIQIANSKLAYAAAMAVKNGKTNGEMEEAIDAYAKAKHDWIDFMNAQAKEHLMDE